MSLGSMKFEVNSDTGFVTVGYGAGSSPTFTRVLVGNGTAAAPSYSFTNDSNTGFYIVPAAPDILYFTAAGTNALRFSGVSGNGYVYSGASNANIGLLAAGGITLSADGTNQNIVLSPTGTGATVVSGASALASGELGNFRLQDASNTNRKLFFGIDNTVAPNGVSYIQSVLTGTTTLPLLLNPNGGGVLIGTAVDSGSKLQVGTNTTTASGGMIFGTDAGLYRQSAGQLQFDHVGGTSPQFKMAASGTTRAYLRADTAGNLVVNSTGTGSVYLAFDNGTGGVIFGDGAVGSVGGVTSAGNASFNGTLGIGGNFTVRKDQAANTSQFIDNRNTAGGEVIWFTEDGLSTEYAYIARYNSAHPTTAKRKALEFGVNGTGAYYSFAAGDVKMTGNAYSSGTRGFSRYKSANGTTASPVEDRIVGFSNTNDLLFNVGMFALNSLTDNSSVWLRFKALDSIGNPQIGLTVTADTVTLSPTGSGQAIISNNSGAGTATRLTIAQTGIRLWYIENTATTGNLTFGDGSGEVLRIIGSGAGTFLFGTATNSNNGRIQLADHTANTGGIGFGADTTLYRNAANALRAEGTTIGQFGINAQSGYESILAFQRAGTPRMTVEVDASDNLRFKNLGSNTRLLIEGGGNATFSGDILFSAANTYDVGSTSNRARSMYVRDLFVTTYTPGSATDTGVAGRICYDTNYIYICTATNTWKRVAIATWP